MSITITGTPDQILAKLEAIREVTRTRKAEGFQLFQPDEEWTYIPIHDERLCPICASFQGPWNGVQVGIEFTDISNQHPFRSLGNNERYPNVHTTYPWLKGQCRCVLHLNDYLFIFNNRLINDIRVAAT